MEEPHLRQTRERLVRSLTHAALRANLLLLAVVAGLFVTLWRLAHETGAAATLSLYAPFSRYRPGMRPTKTGRGTAATDDLVEPLV